MEFLLISAAGLVAFFDPRSRTSDRQAAELDRDPIPSPEEQEALLDAEDREPDERSF
jgi:hypothetical protein